MGVINICACIRLAALVGHVETNSVDDLMLGTANQSVEGVWLGKRRTQVMSTKREDETKIRRTFPPALRRRLLTRTLMQPTKRTRYTPTK